METELIDALVAALPYVALVLALISQWLAYRHLKRADAYRDAAQRYKESGDMLLDDIQAAMSRPRPLPGDEWKDGHHG